MTRKLIAGFAAALMIVGVGVAFAYDAAGEKNALAAIAEFKTADPSLDAFFERATEDHAFEYTVAWVDCLARGSRLGRGIYMRGDHAPLDGFHRASVSDTHATTRGTAAPKPSSRAIKAAASIAWLLLPIAI